MSAWEVICVVVGWSGIAFVVASFWHAFHRRMPKARKLVAAPKCSCGICSGSIRAADLVLTSSHITDVQGAVLAVGSGASRVALLGFDYLGSRGVGNLVIAVVDGPLWAKVCAPAIEKHLTAGKGA